LKHTRQLVIGIPLWVFDLKSCCEIENLPFLGLAITVEDVYFPLNPGLPPRISHPELKNFSSPNSKPTYLSPKLPVELLKRILRLQILGFYSTSEAAKFAPNTHGIEPRIMHKSIEKLKH